MTHRTCYRRPLHRWTWMRVFGSGACFPRPGQPCPRRRVPNAGPLRDSMQSLQGAGVKAP
eukprot:3577054-Pyramimonas_sp.AAC.1